MVGLGVGGVVAAPVLLAVAGYFAVTTLVRLMKVRRDQLMAQLREDFDHEQVRLAHEKKKRKRKEAKEQAARKRAA